jgi:RNA polymerase sigma-70 factor (ECF subfamily)
VAETDANDVVFKECLERAARGDPDGLTQLWRRYQPLLLRYFRGRLPSAAEDLASSVWLDVATDLANFRGSEAGFRGWLFTIAHRRLVDEHRRRERRPQAADVEAPDTPSDIDVHLDATSLEAALALVRRLPPDQAEAVLLRVVADLDVATVAEIMQRREGSVRVLVHRGLERLSTLCQKPVTNEAERTINEVS